MLRWRPRNQSIAAHNAEALRVLRLGPGFGRRSLPKPQSASDPCVVASRNVTERRRGLRHRGWKRAALRVWIARLGFSHGHRSGRVSRFRRAIRIGVPHPASGFPAPNCKAPNPAQTPQRVCPLRVAACWPSLLAKLAGQARWLSWLAKLAGEDCWPRWLATLAG